VTVLLTMVTSSRAAWQKQRAKPKGLTVSDIRDKTPTDPSLACGICNKLIRDAVQTPCCKHVYCEDCIQTHLLDHEFICPSCQIKVSSLTELRPAEGVRSRVNAYIEKAIEESRKEAESNSRDGTPAPAEDSVSRNLIRKLCRY
jgi:protein MPE1